MPPPAATAPREDLKLLTHLLEGAEGFAALLGALQRQHGGSVDGAWGSSSALVAATLSKHVPGTLLVVIAHPGDVDSWGEDLRSFSGAAPLVFPAWDEYPPQADVVDEIAGQRLRLLKRLDDDPKPRCVLTTIQALLQPVPDRAQLLGQSRLLRVAEIVDPEELSAWLVDLGFRRTEAVEIPGEFSRRGGILDVYSLEAEAPYRMEFFGDEIESIRQFSPATQRSTGSFQTVEIVTGQKLTGGSIASGHLCDYLPEGSWTVLVEPDDLNEQGKHGLERASDDTGLFSVRGVFQQLLRFPSIHVSSLPSASLETSCHLRIESVERFSGNVTKLRDELDAAAVEDRVLIACHNEAERHRLEEVLAAGRLAQSDRLRLVVGHVRRGFRMVDAGVVALGDHELFHRAAVGPGGVAPVILRGESMAERIDSFLELSEGDLVVHVSHGIARYRGMQMLDKSAKKGTGPFDSGVLSPFSHGKREEHLVLEFRDAVRMYVPASKIDLVQKYVGGSRTDPELSKVGGVAWQRKDRVEAAVLDLAAEMVDLQALRQAQSGMALPSDTEWQAEFEAAFPYQETPDQLTALAEIKRDLHSPRPMDRLVCGDVGYGKTELAIRAAFKMVDNGKQVAVLVPTTVLAEQHFRTFSQRFAAYPFVIEGISRFRTHGEQKRIVERVASGGVDIIIGTHRLLSADVQFKDLGLVIIDEEQRFGVEHKERLKKLRQMVDVLTMTATPIPRTLHLSLLGIRDISNLETPPPDRLAIETRIVRFDPQLIRHAVLRELNREGQVYFVHNRVHNIQEIASKVQEIVPEVRLAIAHGQMPEHELEQAMLRFVRRDVDVLVATTIIESGLDIPNANTIFINQADNYGLADLHQLRGRVGRYKHRAYAYLLLDTERGVTGIAARRLKAIEEFTDLGAGFNIALRDLEIRGAGNILGSQQSGHIATVGYEMYCQLLENAVRGMKNLPLKTPLEVNIDLPWTAYLPHDYVTGHRQRIEVYRRLAQVRKLERLEDFRQELRDRFGAPPEPTEWMLRLAELRLLATRWQIDAIHLEGKVEENIPPIDVVLGYRSPRKIQRLAERSEGRLRVVDGAAAYWRLRPGEMEPLALHAALKHLLRWPA